MLLRTGSSFSKGPTADLIFSCSVCVKANPVHAPMVKRCGNRCCNGLDYASYRRRTLIRHPDSAQQVATTEDGTGRVASVPPPRHFERRISKLHRSLSTHNGNRRLKSSEPLHTQQCTHIRMFRAVWKEVAHTRTRRVSCSGKTSRIARRPRLCLIRARPSGG